MTLYTYYCHICNKFIDHRNVYRESYYPTRSIIFYIRCHGGEEIHEIGEENIKEGKINRLECFLQPVVPSHNFLSENLSKTDNNQKLKEIGIPTIRKIRFGHNDLDSKDKIRIDVKSEDLL